jgi:hypothetical protein
MITNNVVFFLFLVLQSISRGRNVSLYFVFLFSATCRLAGKSSCLETSVRSHRQVEFWMRGRFCLRCSSMVQ